MSKVWLVRGDCLEKMKDIKDKSVDMILCDLPYGKIVSKTRAFWDSNMDYLKLIKEYHRIIKEEGAIVLFGNEPFSSYIRINMIDIYKYDIKWVKSKTTGFANSNYRPMNKYEDIMVFSKYNASTGGKNKSMKYYPQGLLQVNIKKKNTANRHGLIMKDTNNTGENNSLLKQGSEYIQKHTNYPTNVIFFDNEKKYIHPTQKPVALLEYLIKTYTNEGELVLDNTFGSCSTGIACMNTSRNFIGIEKDDKYFDLGVNRVNEHNNEGKHTIIIKGDTNATQL